MEINVSSSVAVPGWKHQEKRTPVEASIKASRATLNKIRWEKPKQIQSHLSLPDPTGSFHVIWVYKPSYASYGVFKNWISSIYKQQISGLTARIRAEKALLLLSKGAE